MANPKAELASLAPDNPLNAFYLSMKLTAAANGATLKIAAPSAAGILISLAIDMIVEMVADPDEQARLVDEVLKVIPQKFEMAKAHQAIGTPRGRA